LSSHCRIGGDSLGSHAKEYHDDLTSFDMD